MIIDEEDECANDSVNKKIKNQEVIDLDWKITLLYFFFIF